jgi:hypothetical protein
MKKIFAIAAILTLLSIPAFASYTEILSMAGIPVQLSGTDQITQIYPQLISDFKNTAVVEYGVGTWAYTYLGTSLGTIGLAVGPNPGIANVNAPATGSTGGANVNNITGLFYATDMGGMNVGGSLLFGQYGTDTTNKLVASVTNKNDAANGQGTFKLELGASLKASMPIDVALSFAMPTYANSTKTYNAADNLTNNNSESMNAMEIGLNAGTKMGNWIFDLGLKYASASDEVKTWTSPLGLGVVTVNTDNKATDMEFIAQFLAGYKLHATKTLALTFGTGLLFNTDSDPVITNNNVLTAVKTYGTGANSDGVLVLPLYVAIEGKLNDTWSFNAGINKAILRYAATNTKTVSATDGKTKTNESNTSALRTDNTVAAAMGVTATIGDLKVQWMINPLMLLAGPNFISGANNNLAGNVALVYGW